MPGEAPAQSEPRLTIQSRLEDLALLWPWVESIADDLGLAADTRYAIHLCLEEALSNVVRHGYRGAPDGSITVECAPDADGLAFIVEDQALPFDPLQALEPAESDSPASDGEIPLGGQGIRLLKKFAGSLAYQRLPSGNRLTIRFATRP